MDRYKSALGFADLSFGKFALEPPAQPICAIVTGSVCITQGPSAHVKHPYESCNATCVGQIALAVYHLPVRPQT